MYDDILLPIDWQHLSDDAVDHAIAIADRFGATLHVISVTTGDFGEQTRDQLRSNPTEEAERAVETTRQTAEDRSITVVTDLRDGQPHEQIVHYVSEADIDLVVMSSSERGGIERILTRSVANEVTRASEAPVLIVKLDSD